jgi:dipeptidyl aminopeptidase/acylaminoacyl peptidase
MHFIPIYILAFLGAAADAGGIPGAGADPRATELAREVRGKGWIAFAARSPAGDWDLFLMRPDGSDRRNITSTPRLNEGLPRFSPDGRRLLWRRIPRDDTFDLNRHGMQGSAIIGASDGSGAEVLGKPGEYPWASWSPDGKSVACLSPRGISIVDLAARKETRRLERRGFFQQLIWSPDGKWLIGVANSFDTAWSIARMDAATGEASAVSKVTCCTPDWFPDSKRVIFSRRQENQEGARFPYGWTELWMADAEGKERKLVFAEDGRHVYGGCISPDGAYVIFTGNREEDGDPGNAGAPMGILRLADAPTVRGDAEYRKIHPTAKDGPVLVLPAGWEPHWTAADLEPKR